MLIDEANITLKAGHGGAGKVAFNPGRYGGPSGGNGGKGGNIYGRVTSDLTALNQFSQKQFFEADNGEQGGTNKSSGKDAGDMYFEFPIGTLLTETITGKTIDFVALDQQELICKGGLGGRGNYEFRSSTNTTPRNAQPGLPGEERTFKVELKLIADFGLIGLPSAGKSSLLNELTNANAKVGAYDFTTLEPNLGVLHRRVIADIPGLIEGASDGKGLGIKFLKHIEKVHLLLHCVASDSLDVKKDYLTVRKELEDYGHNLTDKQEIILLTKSDLVTKEELTKKTKILQKLNPEILTVSIHDFESIEKLKALLAKS